MTAHRMTAAQLIEMQKPKAAKGRVRGTEPTEINGIKFDSKGEAARWVHLRSRERMGIITDLRRQVAFVLQGRDGPILTPTGRPMTYRADFAYRDSLGSEVIEDYKGWATDVFALKRAILEAQGVTIRIVKAPQEATGHLTDRQLRDMIVGGEEE